MNILTALALESVFMRIYGPRDLAPEYVKRFLENLRTDEPLAGGVPLRGGANGLCDRLFSSPKV